MEQPTCPSCGQNPTSYTVPLDEGGNPTDDVVGAASWQDRCVVCASKVPYAQEIVTAEVKS